MKRNALIAAAFAPAFIVGAAQAQQICEPRGDVIRHLADNYAEAPVAMGLSSNGGVVEILTNQEKTTWTILITMPDGKTCMIAAGESWEELNPVFAALGPKA